MARSAPGAARRYAAALLLAGLAAPVAEAGLQICNDTSVQQSVAIGYKGDTDWTSEGWWNIAPGACATLIPGDLTKRYYYYYAESRLGFEGQNYGFCTRPEAFTIVGDTDCAGRGFAEQGFREIDTGETALDFTLRMPEAGSLPGPDRPAISASGTGPGGGPPGRPAAAVPAEAVLTELDSGLAEGAHGTPFRISALFQGCELEGGRAYCGFHAGGRKLRAFYGGPTPEAMLHALEQMALNTPVLVQGDRLGAEDLQTAVVLRAVTPQPGGDPEAELRAAMQGDWVSAQDGRIGFTIRGSELYTRYDGAFRGARFMELAPTCDAAKGAGPVLVQTKLSDRSTGCYVIERVEEGVMELTDPSRGARLRYLADR